MDRYLITAVNDAFFSFTSNIFSTTLLINEKYEINRSHAFVYFIQAHPVHFGKLMFVEKKSIEAA